MHRLVHTHTYTGRRPRSRRRTAAGQGWVAQQQVCMMRLSVSVCRIHERKAESNTINARVVQACICSMRARLHGVYLRHLWCVREHVLWEQGWGKAECCTLDALVCVRIQASESGPERIAFTASIGVFTHEFWEQGWMGYSCTHVRNDYKSSADLIWKTMNRSCEFTCAYVCMYVYVHVCDHAHIPAFQPWN